MSEKRASKKQREVLEYIDDFIKDNGFGPSYREVMRALNYKSVSTVAKHVDELISRGFLVKRENSARSLQVLTTDVESANVEDISAHLQWLKREIAKREGKEELAGELKTLKAALVLLDQADN